jgi:predicted lipoprotein
MSSESAPKVRQTSHRGSLLALALGVAVVAAMALDTTVVHIGSDNDVRQQAFAPDSYGDKEFPRIQAFIVEKAVDGVAVAAEVLADKAAAAKKYGTMSTTGTIMMVKLVGVAGSAKSGVYDLAVDGMPPEIKVRLQTGPAINGTDLRDAPGDIALACSEPDRIPDAGSAINRAMKKAVLDSIDTAC